MVNRDQRRFLESVVRSDTDASWFIVTTDHVEVSEKGAEFGVVCGQHDVTFSLTYGALFTLEVGLQGDPPNELLNGEGFDGILWRYSAKRQGYYPEVGPCTTCGGVHLPVLTKASAEVIVEEAYEKWFLPETTKPRASVAFKRYVELLDALLLERALHGTLADDVEERFVVAMNDCRQSMTSEEESQIEEVVAQRRKGGVSAPEIR